MKHSLLLISAFLFLVKGFSQNVDKAIYEFQDNTKAKITINENSGIVEFVKFPLNNSLRLSGNTLLEKTINYLQNYKSIYDIKDVENSFNYDEIVEDNYGLKHVTANQIHNGVPVYDGKLKFHFDKQNNLTAVNGNFIPNIKLSTVPTVSQSDANTIAIQEINIQSLNKSGQQLYVNKSELYIFQKGLVQGHFGGRYLVYEVEVRNDLDVREYVFVNAHNGLIVEQFTGIAHALDRVVYENNTSNVVWQEGDAFPGFLSIWQQNEVVASEHVYNFFLNAFGYVSYDGADAQMRTINNNPNISCPNANWNGVTANYCNGTASDDVIAHEWGHAYTEYTNNLIYQWQSGAINESYSDIWGETIDLLNEYEDSDDDQSIRTPGCNSSDRWRMGEDASAFGGAIRDMWNPICQGDPGKVSDVAQYSCGTFDNGGVHINSGIPNHAYALLVDGGTYNGQTINAIGFTKAAHVFWRAQSQYLTSTSDFKVLADALEASAADLIGLRLERLSTGAPLGPLNRSFTAADANEISKAILAVELRINPDSCGYQPILSSVEDPCEASTSNPIFFEDWESGIRNWTVEQIPVNSSTWESRDWVISNTLPVGRQGNAIFATDPINGNCTTDLENGTIRLTSPVINIPDYPDGTFDMLFEHYVATEPDWDGGNIKYRIDEGTWQLLPASAFVENPYNGIINDVNAGNDNPLQGQEAFTGTDGGSNISTWGTSIINLSSLGLMPNSNIQFRFEMGTDGCNGNDGWYIDNITIYNCTETLSIAEYHQLESIVKVFPNPTSGIFSLQKTNRVNLINADIHDINGRLMKSIELSDMGTTKLIDLREVSSGIYFMRIRTTNSQAVIKLLVD
ncbi:MAG: T9SS type A sorting domain-containing protein [Flavobacteriaceae bacterium]|nr:M4 family metallopeptidase [Bacteroidia bacterium]NNL16389.1 T9SS type A sorting domain-containing protein [Flavobacteriaceae bacterium]